MTHGCECEVNRALCFVSLLSSNLRRNRNLILNYNKYLYINCNKYLQNKSFLF